MPAVTSGNGRTLKQQTKNTISQKQKLFLRPFTYLDLVTYIFCQNYFDAGQESSLANSFSKLTTKCIISVCTLIHLVY